MRLRIAILLLTTIVWGSLAGRALGQAGQGYSVALRKVPLADALTYFSQVTGEAVSYDPVLVNTREAYCAIEKASTEALLTCILQPAGLDFVRLSSGTYVVVPPVEQQARRGVLRGQVVDRQDGRPLPDAHIYLASAEGQVGTVSHSDGLFVLPPLLPGRYEVISSYVGYNAWRDTLVVHPGTSGFARIEMMAEPVLFTPVVVDGLQRSARSERLAMERIILGDSLSADAREAGRGLTQLLAAMPGVRVNDIGLDLSIQGGEASEHQLRLDGAPVFLPRGLPGVLGSFSTLAIDRITVHKSGSGAETGSHLAGVTELSHNLSGERTIDAQLDPLAFNARINLASQAGRRPIQTMAAYRGSLNALGRPVWLQETLNTWAQPDAFLILAPLRALPAGSSSLFEDILAVEQNPSPRWGFHDVHGALRIGLSPLQNIHASMYAGRMRYSGALPSTFNVERASDSLSEFQLENAAESVALAVADAYDAVTQTAQVTYSTVVNAHTYASIQARLSRHDMRHRYTLLDSLEQVISFEDNQPAPGQTSFILPTRALSDRSQVMETGLEARIEHAAGVHFFTAGLGTIYHEAALRMLISARPDSLLTPGVADPSTLRRVASGPHAWSHNAFLEDRFPIGRRGTIEAGLRLTYLPSHETVFAEPRIAYRTDRPFLGGDLAWRTAAGIYRQYLSRFDVSTYNAGAILPALRVWLPVDRSLQPPKAFHATQSFRLDFASGWMAGLEAYYKWLPNTLSLNYLYIDTLGELVSNGVNNVETQQSFLAQGETVHAGASAIAGMERGAWRTRIVYDLTYARRRSPQLFNNRRTTLPWITPHRLTATASFTPVSSLVITGRWTSEWGRTWAFRQAYYDFFGQNPFAPPAAPLPLDTPDRHVLRPFHQLDLGAALTRPVGDHRIQARVDLLNMLDRRNEVDWRYVLDTNQFKPEARYHYPRNLSIAVRWIW